MRQERKRSHPKEKKKRVVAPDSVPGDQAVLSFSFRYFWDTDPNFPSSECTREFFAALLDRMRYYGSMTVEQFTLEDHRENRHPIYWDEINIEGFPHDPAEVFSDSAWQFCLHSPHDPEHKWRIHGFLYNSTFYIVWFDPNHYLKTVS